MTSQYPSAATCGKQRPGFEQQNICRPVRCVREDLNLPSGASVEGETGDHVDVLRAHPITGLLFRPCQQQWTFDMAKCVCGRQFSSNDALIQHQDAKSQNGNSCSDGSAPSKRLPWSERWLWHNVRGRDEPISIVPSHALEASSMAVSSTVESELICTYNWQECDEARIHVPGMHAPTSGQLQFRH